MITKGPMLII